MKPIDYIIIALAAIWLVLSVAYIVSSKRKGKTCCHCSEACRKICKNAQKSEECAKANALRAKERTF